MLKGKLPKKVWGVGNNPNRGETKRIWEMCHNREGKPKRGVFFKTHPWKKRGCKPRDHARKKNNPITGEGWREKGGFFSKSNPGKSPFTRRPGERKSKKN